MMVSDDKDNPYRRTDFPNVANDKGPFLSEKEARKLLQDPNRLYEDEGPFISEEVARKLLQEPNGQYPRDTSKALWVVIGTVLVTSAVGTALWLESTSAVKKDDHKSSYSAPANPNYSAPAPHEAYLKDGTSYKFYIINNEVAVTELGGKPVIDSLEGKLGK